MQVNRNHAPIPQSTHTSYDNMCVYKHRYIRAHAHTHTCTQSRMHTRTHKYTHTHTHTRDHILSDHSIHNNMSSLFSQYVPHT